MISKCNDFCSDNFLLCKSLQDHCISLQNSIIAFDCIIDFTITKARFARYKKKLENSQSTFQNSMFHVYDTKAIDNPKSNNEMSTHLVKQIRTKN